MKQKMKQIAIDKDELRQSLTEEILSLKDEANKLLDQIKALKNTKAHSPNFDEKDFGIGAQMIHAVGINNIKLLSNSDKIKRVGMSGYGLQIVSYENY